MGEGRLYPRLRFAPPGVTYGVASPRLWIGGGGSTPGSASLRQGLLMVSPLRGWESVQEELRHTAEAGGFYGLEVTNCDLQ